MSATVKPIRKAALRTLDVIAQNLAVALRSALSESLSAFSASRHVIRVVGWWGWWCGGCGGGCAKAGWPGHALAARGYITTHGVAVLTFRLLNQRRRGCHVGGAPAFVYNWRRMRRRLHYRPPRLLLNATTTTNITAANHYQWPALSKPPASLPEARRPASSSLPSRRRAKLP